MNLWHLVLSAGLMAKVVLLVLFGLSVFTWAVILVKIRGLREAFRGLKEAERALKESEDLRETVENLRGISEGWSKEVLKEWLRRYSRLKKEFPRPSDPHLRSLWLLSLKDLFLAECQRVREERLHSLKAYLGFLATVGNTAPFIGLFGTVWGIMNAFHRIGLKGSASLATVAPGIAEALIATAMGLFAAIPAVMAYNHFLRKGEALREAFSQMEEKLAYFCTCDLLKESLG